MLDVETYEEALDGAAETGGRGCLAVFAAFDALGGQGESSVAHVVFWWIVRLLKWYCVV